MRRTPKGGRAGRIGVVLALIVLATGCGSAEPEAPLPAPPAEAPEAGQRALQPPPPTFEKRPTAPIPPLEGAERPSESPLVAILEEGLPALPDPPELELPAILADGAARPSPLPQPGLGLDELSARLRDTDALGVFTKLSLKNQIDDLLAEVSRFHEKGRGKLAKLRGRYDSLVLKIMSLVQDEEPRLATEIARSREKIWSILADPDGFAELAQREVS